MSEQKPKAKQHRISAMKIFSVSGVTNAVSYYCDNKSRRQYIESVALAKGTPVNELILSVLPDRDGPPDENGKIRNPIYVISSYHYSRIGTLNLSRRALDFLNQLPEKEYLEPISVSSGIANDRLHLLMIVRLYKNKKGEYNEPDFRKIFDYLEEEKLAFKDYNSGLNQKQKQETDSSDKEKEDETQSEEFKEKLELQKYRLDNSTPDAPFLNMIDDYISTADGDKQENLLVYNLADKQRAEYTTYLPYEEFNDVFVNIMHFLMTVEKDSYNYAISAPSYSRDGLVRDFMKSAEVNINRLYVNTPQKTLPPEDVPFLLRRLKKSLFELYIVQDLINEPSITDIKITDPYSVRVRISGKTYLSDVTFIDSDDYIRFVDMLMRRNNLDPNLPTQTFTDTRDPNYILRFTITADYVTANGFPVVHIRKISRRKMTGRDLIKAGMFDEKIMKYLIDCGRKSSGVVFAGPPGSGKTHCLNWFIDAGYEDTAEILVIQENDELFSDKKGVIFEHVVNTQQGYMQPCSLEDLGRMALVSGANVFVIGEAKGGEICSAITLSNSGCRIAMTIHSPSAAETLDKMADLAMRGYATDYVMAKRMLKSFQTIVYLKDFKVQEIKEVVGFSEEKKDMIYKTIYDRNFVMPDKMLETTPEYDMTGEELYTTE